MPINNKYHADVEEILSHRHDLDADYWTTPDNRLLKGSPFSAYSCTLMLLDLGMEPSDPILQTVSELFFNTWKPDGRFKVYPKGGILPCHTAYVVHLLCRMGYQADERIQKTFRYFLDTPYVDGGWRCNKFSYGRGPETMFMCCLSMIRQDERFLEAFVALQDKLAGNQLTVERISPKLSKLTFYKKNQPSEIMTTRYQEICMNLIDKS